MVSARNENENKKMGVPYKIINGKRVYGKKKYLGGKRGFGAPYRWEFIPPPEEEQEEENEQN